MRDISRIERICNLIKARWIEDPDLRLGQLLMNLVFGNTGGKHTAHIFYKEDDAIEKALDIKRCSKCGFYDSYDNFYYTSTTKKYDIYCKPCRRKSQVEYDKRKNKQEFENKIDEMDFLTDEDKSKLKDHQVKSYYEEYKPNHNYFSIKGLTNDFLSSLGFDTGNRSGALDDVVRVLRFRFVRLIKRDDGVKKISGYSYKVIKNE